MHNDLPSEEYEESLIVQAHNFFKAQVSKWLDDRQEDASQAAEALEQAVSGLLELVVIDLDPSDDPHIIFETLNARGTPLLQSDLIKNMVLFEAEKAGVASNKEESPQLWNFDASKKASKYWKKEIQQGRLVRPRIDVFLNYWLVMRRRKEVVAHEVFSEFRRYYENQNKPSATSAFASASPRRTQTGALNAPPAYRPSGWQSIPRRLRPRPGNFCGTASQRAIPFIRPPFQSFSASGAPSLSSSKPEGHWPC